MDSLSDMHYKQYPKIAILLAAYNGMQWIEEQIDTVLNQQDVDMTIYISVDLSTDGTYEWAKSLAAKHKNVVLLPYGERFGGAGPNFFRLVKDVDFSGFDAVAFADQDDIWHPEKLAKAYSKIAAGHCDVYSSNVTAFWADGREVLIKKSQPQKKLDHFFEAAGPGCTYVFSQAAMQTFKTFLIAAGDDLKQVSLHDWLAYAFCREQGFTWFIDEWSSMRYRQHENNQVGTNNNLTAYKKRFAMIRDKWLRNQVNIITALVAPEKLAQLNSRLYLMANFNELRRRYRDRLFLFLMVLFGIY